jgi:hypothetical protein
VKNLMKVIVASWKNGRRRRSNLLNCGSGTTPWWKFSHPEVVNPPLCLKTERLSR